MHEAFSKLIMQYDVTRYIICISKKVEDSYKNVRL